MILCFIKENSGIFRVIYVRYILIIEKNRVFIIKKRV